MVWKGLSLNKAWYVWHYSPSLNLLLLLPKDIPSAEQRLWTKILQACDLSEWQQLVEERADCILSQEGLTLLIEHFKPHWTWIVSANSTSWSGAANTHLIFTEHYSSWFQDPKVKQQIWHQWLAIQALAALPS